MFSYDELDWMGLLSLLISDLVFRMGKESALQDEERWQNKFTSVRSDVSWGKQRDEKAWEEMVRRVRLRTMRLFPEDVREEVIQKIMVKLLSTKTLERVAAARNVDAYLDVVLRNLVSDIHRYESPLLVKEVSLLGLLSREGTILSEGDPSQVHSLVPTLRKELRSLPENDRKLLRMRFWDELTIGQIAEKQNERYSTIAVRLFRLLKKLRTQIRLNR
jgi:RNA polymerase sigma factor (sigma-70 family)